MRITLLSLVLAASAACKKDEPKPTPPAAEPAPATPPPAPAAAAPATPPPAEPAAAAAAEAKPAEPAAADENEVRPPTAADLETYTKDLKGKGPLTAVIETSQGKITCELRPDKAPITVANFVGLARGLKPFRDPRSGMVTKRPFYDGLTFHRVIPGFMVQGGDPTGTGSGTPGYRFQTEVDPAIRHDRPGTLAMANSGPNSNGSQFYITETPQPQLDGVVGNYNVFGYCKEVDVVKKIARVEKDPMDPQGSRPKTIQLIKKVTIKR